MGKIKDKNRQTKEYVYLADEKLGIEKNVQSKIIGFAHDISYSKTGERVVRNEMISPTIVMHKVRQEEFV